MASQAVLILMRLQKAFLAYSAFAASIAGASSALYLGLSDHRSNLPSLAERKRAAESGFCNADSWLRLADLKRASGESSIYELGRAGNCNPLNSETYILLGLENESKGNTDRARGFLLKATQVDHGFVPRWSLASFYLRHGQDDLFFQWTREALARASSDIMSVFPLCWTASNDKNRILTAIPRRGIILRQYLAWLTLTRHLDAAYDVFQLVEDSDLSLVPDTVVSLCDQLNDAGERERALAVWNRVCGKSARSDEPCRSITR